MTELDAVSPLQSSPSKQEDPMKANCWYGKQDVRVEEVEDPKIINRQDAIIKITASAICGSDLHLYNNLVPTME